MCGVVELAEGAPVPATALWWHLFVQQATNIVDDLRGALDLSWSAGEYDAATDTYVLHARARAPQHWATVTWFQAVQQRLVLAEVTWFWGQSAWVIPVQTDDVDKLYTQQGLREYLRDTIAVRLIEHFHLSSARIDTWVDSMEHTPFYRAASPHDMFVVFQPFVLPGGSGRVQLRFDITA